MGSQVRGQTKTTQRAPNTSLAHLFGIVMFKFFFFVFLGVQFCEVALSKEITCGPKEMFAFFLPFWGSVMITYVQPQTCNEHYWAFFAFLCGLGE